METRSSILAWTIPWTKEPGGYSPWGLKERDTTEQLTLYHDVPKTSKVFSEMDPNCHQREPHPVTTTHKIPPPFLIHPMLPPVRDPGS